MHHAVPATILASLLIAGSAFAAAPPPTASTAAVPPATAATAALPAPAASAAPALSADQKRMAAIRQYQHDLVNVVALRNDPDYLLGAALLTRPFKQQIPELRFDALSARASGAPGAGPATRWIRLGLCHDKAACPNPEAWNYLKEHAADNAAVWLVAMDVAAAHKDAKAERTAFGKAVDAQMYDDYFGKALAGVAKVVGVLPPLPDTIEGAHDGQPDTRDGVRVLVVLDGTGGYPHPGFDPVIAWCDPAAVAKKAGRKADCLKLAHTLQWGSSPIARAAGLHIQGALDSDSKDETEQESRDLAWQVHRYSQLLQQALVDPTLASRWLAAARNGGTELSLILATLRANHLPTSAPADFQPAPAGGD